MRNKTVAIQIGNTDNKLTQQNWSEFVKAIKDLFSDLLGVRVHFFGGSATYESWQNVCWVVEIDSDTENFVVAQLIGIRAKYLQDSIAWTEGTTKFF